VSYRKSCQSRENAYLICRKTENIGMYMPAKNGRHDDAHNHEHGCSSRAVKRFAVDATSSS